MRTKYHVSDAEWEVLKMLWRCGGAVRQSQLPELFAKEGKTWKRQTLNTFLARMQEKGLVKRENGIASAVFSEDEYNLMQMRESIDTLYGGKLSSFFAAFMDGNEINEDELEELYQIIKQRRK